MIVRINAVFTIRLNFNNTHAKRLLDKDSKDLEFFPLK